MKKIVLASSSPRRKELLEKIGLTFETETGEHEEAIDANMEPHELVRKSSRDKAGAIASKYPQAVIISADTIGVLDGNIFGKPHNAIEAKKMLRALSGRLHTVITGFTIIDTGINKMLSKSVETKVYIKKLSESEIDAYVRSGEPLDKAGAYAIQGLGAVIVERIEGDYYNVVGLPVNELVESLKEFGIDIWEKKAK